MKESKITEIKRALQSTKELERLSGTQPKKYKKYKKEKK